MAAKYEYDLVVIGGGSGGSATARRAAQYGKKVLIVDRGVTYDGVVRHGAGAGGTRLNAGCVPKKLMFAAGTLLDDLRGRSARCAGFGIEVGDVGFDWARLKAARDAYVERARANYVRNYVRNWGREGIDYASGYGRLRDGHTVEVDLLEAPGQARRSSVTVEGRMLPETRTYAAAKVVLAPGGAPRFPAIPGAELCVSSENFFDLADQPKRAAVIGAGYVSVIAGSPGRG